MVIRIKLWGFHRYAICSGTTSDFYMNSQYFSYIVAISFIGGRHRRTRRKPPTCRNLLTNKIYRYCTIYYLLKPDVLSSDYCFKVKTWTQNVWVKKCNKGSSYCLLERKTNNCNMTQFGNLAIDYLWTY